MALGDFMALYAGNRSSYGRYILQDKKGKKGQKNKGKAVTIHASEDPLTTKIWEEHVKGSVGLGIVPISEKSQCRFGAVDIDVYDGLDHKKINATILNKGLPLVPTLSKSGGCHLWLFTKDWIPAEEMQTKLKEMAAFFGFAHAEIFPKQTKLNTERGDSGQWINLPYYGGTRLCLDEEHKLIPDLDGFTIYARNRQVGKKQVEEIDSSVPDILPGGPPCLQRLCQSGFPDGTRNNGLYNLGVFAKKAFPDRWKVIVDEYNTKYMDPPVGSTEVQAVVKSLGTKTYQYKCSDSPINAFCDKPKCFQCKHGVGGGEDWMPKQGSMILLRLEPVIFSVEIMGPDGEARRVDLSTEQLYSPTFFARACIEQAQVVPSPVKQTRWLEIVRELLRDCHIHEFPEDVKPSGMLILHLQDFVISHPFTEEPEGLCVGKVWRTEYAYNFRMQEFMTYLQHVGFREMGRNTIGKVMRDKGVVCESARLDDGASIRYWQLKRNASQEVQQKVPAALAPPPFA